MSLVGWQLSIVCTLSELIVLGGRRLCWEELVKCVVIIVHNFVEQFIVSLLQQLMICPRTL